MTFSVDDLVSSFASNHVGQEAIDLALLQNQLAQTLCEGSPLSGGQSILVSRPYPRGRARVAQPCTTPTAQTPSLSTNPGWCMAMMSRSRSNSVPSACVGDQMDVDMTNPMDTLRSYTGPTFSAYMEDIEQDEKLVEDLLIPPPPLSASLSESQIGITFLSSTPRKPSKDSVLSITDQTHISSMTGLDTPSSPAGSIFTSTDPFYISQLESLHHATHPQSLFAQHGRLPHNSPFAPCNNSIVNDAPTGRRD